MDCSTPGLPVHHQLPEFTQINVHWVSDAIQPSNPVFPFLCLQSSPASGSFQMSQLFISGGQSLLKLMSPNHLILCHPLLIPPLIFPSIRVFSNESVLHIRWPKYWSFNFSISLSNEYSGLISFRMEWLDLLAVQGTLKSLLQHHNSKASISICILFIVTSLLTL